jgi:hypothetical protein
MDWRVSHKELGVGTIVMHIRDKNWEGKPYYMVRFDKGNRTLQFFFIEDELEVIDWARWCDVNVPGSSNSYRWTFEDKNDTRNLRCDTLHRQHVKPWISIQCAHKDECRHVKSYLKHCEDSRRHEKMMEERARKSVNYGFQDNTDWGKWNDNRDNDDQEEFYNQF